MYYLARASEEPPQPSQKGFALFDELEAAFLKFPVVDRLTEANRACKKFGFPKCVGRGLGQSTIPIQVKISCFKMIKIVLTLIYSNILLSAQS